MAGRGRQAHGAAGWLAPPQAERGMPCPHARLPTLQPWWNVVVVQTTASVRVELQPADDNDGGGDGDGNGGGGAAGRGPDGSESGGGVPGGGGRGGSSSNGGAGGKGSSGAADGGAGSTNGGEEDGGVGGGSEIVAEVQRLPFTFLFCRGPVPRGVAATVHAPWWLLGWF